MAINALCLFLAVPWINLWCMFLTFPGHEHLFLHYEVLAQLFQWFQEMYESVDVCMDGVIGIL